MNITFKKTEGKDFEIKMTGRLDECQVIVEALDNSVNEVKTVRDATNFLLKKLNEHKRRG